MQHSTPRQNYPLASAESVGLEPASGASAVIRDILHWRGNRETTESVQTIQRTIRWAEDVIDPDEDLRPVDELLSADLVTDDDAFRAAGLRLSYMVMYGLRPLGPAEVETVIYGVDTIHPRLPEKEAELGAKVLAASKVRADLANQPAD